MDRHTKKKLEAAENARRKEARVSSSAIAMLNHAMMHMPPEMSAALRNIWMKNAKSEEWSAAVRKLVDVANLRALLAMSLTYAPDDLKLKIIEALGGALMVEPEVKAEPVKEEPVDAGTGPKFHKWADIKRRKGLVDGVMMDLAEDPAPVEVNQALDAEPHVVVPDLANPQAVAALMNADRKFFTDPKGRLFDITDCDPAGPFHGGTPGIVRWMHPNNVVGPNDCPKRIVEDDGASWPCACTKDHAGECSSIPF